MKYEEILVLKKRLSGLYKGFIVSWGVLLGAICVLGYVALAIKQNVTWNSLKQNISDLYFLFRDHFNITTFGKISLSLAPVYLIVTTVLLLLVLLAQPVHKKKPIILSLLFVPFFIFTLPFGLIISFGWQYAFDSMFSSVCLELIIIMIILTCFYLGMLFMCFWICDKHFWKGNKQLNNNAIGEVIKNPDDI